MEENGTVRANKRLKLGKDDRISALPDSLIQHILSFLPSTKQAIQTGILSKRWQYQWSRVPILIFDSTGKSDENFSHFIDRTLILHNCFKIKKFHIQYDKHLGIDPQITSKIRFATQKHVEELILQLFPLLLDEADEAEVGVNVYTLLKFLFENASLVKLELFKCYFKCDWKTNWPRLKELKVDFSFSGSDALENLVSGSPLLESLEISCLGSFVITSKSLKRLIFVEDETICNLFDGNQIEISCPNLEELSLRRYWYPDILFPKLPSKSKTIGSVLSGSPLLHTLELPDYGYSGQLVIASKSLKKLVLGKSNKISDIEISCPDLEQLNLHHFEPDVLGGKEVSNRRLAIKILRQVQNVKLLDIGSWLIETLSALEVEDLSSPLLKCKCLTLDGTNFDEHLLGIVCAIRSSPVLEKLVIRFELNEHPFLPVLKDCRKKYWNSNGTFNCSVSNLKTVKIVGLSKNDDRHKLLFNFVEFLLKTARALEKIVFIVAEDCGRGGLPFEVSKKLLSFQRCYPHVMVELLCSN